MTPIAGLGSRARDINDAGQVVGSAEGSASLWHSGVLELLPEPSAAAHDAEALGINNDGLIVGYTNIAGYEHAAVWDRGEAHLLVDLIPPDSGWAVLDRATDVNSFGQIVGWGSRAPGGSLRAFLLTPIPEPSTLLLLLVGFSGITRRRG
jgi:uncharacterized membrane protein